MQKAPDILLACRKVLLVEWFRFYVDCRNYCQLLMQLSILFYFLVPNSLCDDEYFSESSYCTKPPFKLQNGMVIDKGTINEWGICKYF